MRVLALSLAFLAVSCTRTTPGPPTPAEEGAVRAPMAPEQVPPEWAPLVARAEAAIAELQGTLGQRLFERLAEAGAAGAVEVCAEEAQPLGAAVAARHRLAVGRTSARLRNQANRPRPWVEAWLERHEGASAAAARPEVHDLGDRLGVVRPIATAAPCLRCHGEEGAVEPGTRALLRDRYPADRAFGLAEGDLRGAFWVEVSKAGAQ